ncbi:MAG TPA: hypothetical protein VL137_00475 [Polyangiaceae bacterium]|nr:hypothetical protein [Polyangiaceae bacterium]
MRFSAARLRAICRSCHSCKGALWGFAVLGCGSASPLLHPAHTLDQNQIAVGGGVSTRFISPSAQRRIDEGKSIAATHVVDNGPEEQTFVEGTLLNHSLSSGVAPWTSARVGLGHSYEAGLDYTGNRIRVDGRHAFQNENVALSIGLGATAVLTHLNHDLIPVSTGSQPPGRLNSDAYDFSSAGFGFDVPVLFGVRTATSWFEPSFGVRVGYEQVHGQIPTVLPVPIAMPPATMPPNTMQPQTTAAEQDVLYADATGRRLSAEGLVGLSTGSAPVFLRLELGVGLQHAFGAVEFPSDSGVPARRTLSLTGVSIDPAAALVFEL